MTAGVARESRTVGRYALYGELAAGGMATVHLGRLAGPAGFARTVAIKRLHAQYAKDPEFVSMFLDEARLAACVRHPNVVSTLDVVVDDGEVFLVMDYIRGDSLFKLCRFAPGAARGEPRDPLHSIPLPIAVGILSGVLAGLHEAHETRDEQGDALGIVHRDVSPQNILVGVDGIARVLDFGVAKAARRLTSTRDGDIKGKIRYMAPEQLRGQHVDRRVDVFSASVVLWEMLTGVRLFQGEDPSVFVARLLGNQVEAPSSMVPELSPLLDEIVLRGLAIEREDRFGTARDLAVALENAVVPATPREIGAWVERTSGAELEERAALVAELERAAEDRSGEPMPPGLADLARDARARDVRARMATDLSLSGPPASSSSVSQGARRASGSEGTETTLSAHVPASFLHRPRVTPARVGLSVAAMLAGLALWVAWPRPPASLGVPASSSIEAASNTPREEPHAAPSSVAPEPPSGTLEGGSRKASPGTMPSARPTHPPASTAKPTKPVASGKPTLCMKHRADGIVYFEACP